MAAPQFYTVACVSVIEQAGDQVTTEHTSVTLIITPDPGYTVDATNFYVALPLPDEVSSVDITQNGANVEVEVFFDDGFIMPSSDVHLLIDINGFATETEYSIEGTYEIVTSNTNLTSGTGNVYSASGNVGDIVDLFSLTFTADVNYAFEVSPTYTVFLTNTLPDNYSVTREDTYTDDLLTEVTYTVKYTLSDSDVTGDKLKFTANAVEQLVVVTPTYYAYALDKNLPKKADGTYYTDLGPTFISCRVYGNVGSRVTMDLWDGTTSTNLYTNEEIVLDPLGYIELPFSLPEAVATTTYEITFSGDISPDFQNPNPIVIEARGETTATLDNLPLTGYTIVKSGVLEVSGIVGPVPIDNYLSATFNAQFTVTEDTAAVLKILRVPTWADIDNTDPALNGGTQLLVPSSLTITGDNTPEILVEVSGEVVIFGLTNPTFTLDLTGVISTI